mmetsp:Transcript_2627/g.6139  ORF Transcript_2627/g.6139 Transcript_2627/m.6139 type:complete len:317 (+) Transcript_2627:552-1502(+)
MANQGSGGMLPSREKKSRQTLCRPQAKRWGGSKRWPWYSRSCLNSHCASAWTASVDMMMQRVRCAALLSPPLPSCPSDVGQKQRHFRASARPSSSGAPSPRSFESCAPSIQPHSTSARPTYLRHTVASLRPAAIALSLTSTLNRRPRVPLITSIKSTAPPLLIWFCRKSSWLNSLQLFTATTRLRTPVSPISLRLRSIAVSALHVCRCFASAATPRSPSSFPPRSRWLKAAACCNAGERDRSPFPPIELKARSRLVSAEQDVRIWRTACPPSSPTFALLRFNLVSPAKRDSADSAAGPSAFKSPRSFPSNVTSTSF